jgi:hypothetical protein
VVVNLPKDHPNWADIMTGVGTVALAGIALLAGVLTAAGYLFARRSQHAETYNEVSKRWNDSGFRGVRWRLVSYHNDGKPDEDTEFGPDKLRDKLVGLRDFQDFEFFRLQTAMDFFEDLAMLVRYRAISIKMVDDSLGGIVCLYWRMLRTFVFRQRETLSDAEYCQEFEGLAKRISRRHHNLNAWKIPDDNPTLFEKLGGVISKLLRERLQRLPGRRQSSSSSDLVEPQSPATANVSVTSEDLS